jgi:hypothetical protein
MISRTARQTPVALKMVLAGMILSACGGGSSDKQGDPFELEGNWVYSGIAKNYSSTIAFSGTSMVEADTAGTWSGTWSIQAYDNSQDHFRLALESKTGSPPFEVGSVLFVSYILSGDTLVLYWAKGDYPATSGGTEGKDYATYTKQK